MKRGDWWYLFVSGGSWQNHTYHLEAGRSRNPTGPFFDFNGVSMKNGAAVPILYSDEGDFFYGPGHNGDVFTTVSGKTYMFFHSHCADTGKYRSNERPTLLQELKWTADGWPYFEGGKPQGREELPCDWLK